MPMLVCLSRQLLDCDTTSPKGQSNRRILFTSRSSNTSTKKISATALTRCICNAFKRSKWTWLIAVQITIEVDSAHDSINIDEEWLLNPEQSPALVPCKRKVCATFIRVCHVATNAACNSVCLSMLTARSECFSLSQTRTSSTC